MAMTLTCLCGKKLQIRDELAGRQGACPSCGRVLDIPPPGADAMEIDYVAVESVPEAVPDLPLQAYHAAPDAGLIPAGAETLDIPPIPQGLPDEPPEAEPQAEVLNHNREP